MLIGCDDRVVQVVLAEAEDARERVVRVSRGAVPAVDCGIVAVDMTASWSGGEESIDQINFVAAVEVVDERVREEHGVLEVQS